MILYLFSFIFLGVRCYVMLIRSNKVLHVEVMVQLELILCGSSGIICVMSMVIRFAIGKISISNAYSCVQLSCSLITRAIAFLTGTGYERGRGGGGRGYTRGRGRTGGRSRGGGGY